MISNKNDCPSMMRSFLTDAQELTVILLVGLVFSGMAEPPPADGNGSDRSKTPGGVSSAAAAEIADLEKEKAARTKAQEKLDSQIVLALKKGRGEPPFDKPTQVQVQVPIDAEGRVLVDIKATVSTGLLSALESLGGKVIGSYPAFGTIRASVPLEGLEKLAMRADVQSCRLAARATTH